MVTCSRLKYRSLLRKLTIKAKAHWNSANMLRSRTSKRWREMWRIPVDYGNDISSILFLKWTKFLAFYYAYCSCLCTLSHCTISTTDIWFDERQLYQQSTHHRFANAVSWPPMTDSMLSSQSCGWIIHCASCHGDNLHLADLQSTQTVFTHMISTSKTMPHKFFKFIANIYIRVKFQERDKNCIITVFQTADENEFGIFVFQYRPVK